MFTLSACSPKYDWREVRGTSAPFVVMLPGKPSTQTRTINLDGVQVAMTMTAAEVDGATFAVGSAELPDAAKAQAALQAMKTGMIRNVGGTVTREKAESSGGQSIIELDASGPPGSGGDARKLSARFVQKGQRAYQVIVLGGAKPVPQEEVDTFLTSFKAE
jgi:hypothetical protein